MSDLCTQATGKAYLAMRSDLCTQELLVRPIRRGYKK